MVGVDFGDNHTQGPSNALTHLWWVCQLLLSCWLLSAHVAAQRLVIVLQGSAAGTKRLLLVPCGPGSPTAEYDWAFFLVSLVEDGRG